MDGPPNEYEANAVIYFGIWVLFITLLLSLINNILNRFRISEGAISCLGNTTGCLDDPNVRALQQGLRNLVDNLCGTLKTGRLPSISALNRFNFILRLMNMEINI